jgi:hypothetical protein
MSLKQGADNPENAISKMRKDISNSRWMTNRPVSNDTGRQFNATVNEAYCKLTTGTVHIGE